MPSSKATNICTRLLHENVSSATASARSAKASRAFSLFQDEEYKEAAKVFAEGELSLPLIRKAALLLRSIIQQRILIMNCFC